MLQPAELLIRLGWGESSHYSKSAPNAGNWPISEACSHMEGRSPLFLFQGSLHLSSCQKKEHSMRTKQDPSTTLSTGKRTDAMHKHCCSQFNSQGRMGIILDLIQAGYRGQLYGNACILQISSREWNYGETHSLPRTTEQTETENMLLMIQQLERQYLPTLIVMYTEVKKIKLVTKYPRLQESKHWDQILSDLLPLPSEQLLARVKNSIKWDQLCYFRLKSADGAYACRQ